ncbi:MAG TPA: D-glycerate dehydrogenase [Gaiellaceae bacterium]|nr:D-glycerate dehydrogenase [Gaiellaceae bacterium]
MRVLASRRFPGPAWDELRDVEYADGSLDRERRDIEALAVVAETVDERTLELLPNLRVVANYGAGFDLVDVEACRRRGVIVTNTPGVTSAATADLTLGLILAVRRRIVAGDAFVRSGGWGSGWADEPLEADEVTGSTLGIVGLGRIGGAVAQRARGFEMRILYTRRREIGEPGYRPLDQLLAESDIVSIHLPLTEETRGLIDEQHLALMRDGACLVNTARGQIVDERALVAELVSGRLQAGLDVFADEPKVPQELFELPNVVMTPHLGTATQATREAMTRVLVDNLLAVEAGRPPPNAV